MLVDLEQMEQDLHQCLDKFYGILLEFAAVVWLLLPKRTKEDWNAGLADNQWTASKYIYLWITLSFYMYVCVYIEYL